MSDLADVISRNEEQIRAEWIRDMRQSVQRGDLMSKTELDEQCATLLNAVVAGVRSGTTDVMSAGWTSAREFLEGITASRARQGFSPTEVATFVLSLKHPLFGAIRHDMGKSQDKLFEAIWTATEMLDRLALITAEAYIATREELISRQQQELMELSTPVVKLWDGILALPHHRHSRQRSHPGSHGKPAADSGRHEHPKSAIIDITGVPTVDTLVAQHLLKTITAARLMGADCIISGSATADCSDHRASGHQSGIRHHPRQVVRRVCARAPDERAHGCPPGRFRRHLRRPSCRAVGQTGGLSGANSRSSHGQSAADHHPGGHARQARPSVAG